MDQGTAVIDVSRPDVAPNLDGRKPWDRRRRMRLRVSYPQAYLLILPAMAMIVILVFYPLALSVWDSLHDDNLLVQSHAFVGAQNYSAVVTSPEFQRAAYNTLGYLVLATLGSLIIGGATAFWLHGLARFRAIALAIVVLPWAVPGTVTGALWSLIFNPQTGLLDSILLSLHLINHPVIWLDGTLSGIIVVSITLIWQIAPITAVIMLAGLESIPGTLLEQARVDGASRLAVAWRIKLPLLRPALAIGLLEASILGIGAFDQIVVLNGYSPGTISVVMEVYLYAFQDFNFGQGIAASMIVTVVTLVVSVAYLKGLYREVAY
jgi:multiple sugar transport system permease protein